MFKARPDGRRPHAERSSAKKKDKVVPSDSPGIFVNIYADRQFSDTKSVTKQSEACR